jgi:uncharacterized protein
MFDKGEKTEEPSSWRINSAWTHYLYYFFNYCLIRIKIYILLIVMNKFWCRKVIYMMNLHILHAIVLSMSLFWALGAADGDQLGLMLAVPVVVEQSSIIPVNQSQKKQTIERVMFDVQENELSNKTIKRHGIFTQHPNAQATIVICHGFMADKYDVGCLRYLFAKKKFNTLVFDFRAHGDNREGQLCTFGKDEAYDVIGAAHFVKQQPTLSQKPIIVYGMSMGAVASIEAQASEGNLFDAMILDCPFASSERVIQFGLRNAKISFLGYTFNLPGKEFLAKHASHPYLQPLVKYLLRTKANFDTGDINTIIHPLYPVESVKKITIPCFFIHCKNDERVSTDDVKILYAGVQGFKRLWITNGRRHYDSVFYDPEKYKKRVNAFLRTVLDGSYKTAVAEEVIEDESQEVVLLANDTTA